MRTHHIFLIKHGETEENRFGIHQGQALGGTLSSQGIADIRQVAATLADLNITIDRMLVSPMSRCQQSAALLADRLAPPDVRQDPRLSAKNSGHLGGKPRHAAAAEAATAGVPIHQLRTPGGESSEDVQARYLHLWNEVISAPPQTTILVGHGGGIACLLLHLTGRSFTDYLDLVPGSAATTWLEVTDGTPRFRCVNAPPSKLSGQHNARTTP